MNMRFFTAEQARDVAALAERIFPAGPDCPGAQDIHVVDYIDGQLAADWGQGAGMYKQGPYQRPAHAGHGWQLAMTPAETYVYGLAALNQYCNSEFASNFADLPTNNQDAVLEELAGGLVPTFVELGGSDFFHRVRQNVLEGLFSDPCYGGNHELLGWKWVGYPGVANEHGEDYANYIDKHADPYSPEPRALP